MNKIIACVDGSTYTEAVADYSIWAAGRLQVPLEFLHVQVKDLDPRLDASGSIGLGAQETLLAELAALDEQRNVLAREHGRRVLEAVHAKAVAAGLTDVEVRQRLGYFIDTLVELQGDTRLFVLGKHDEQGRPKRFLLDHNLEGAIRTLERPILVATADFKPPRNFMIAFDASTTGKNMVERVAGSPLLQGLECSIAMVGIETSALQWAEDLLKQSGFQVRTAQLEGDATEALLNHAAQEDIDMLVMGAYGHSRIRQWVVGSTTTAILGQANLPIFILR